MGDVEDGLSGGEAGMAVNGPRRGRAAPRDSLFMLGTMRRGDEAALEIRVRNLSSTGLMAETTGSFAPGDRVEIDLRGVGTIAAQVIWREGARAGLSFLWPIDPRKARKPVAVKPVASAPAPGPRLRRPRLFG